jgi:alginate O-acetyltransferase complex protein AlgI
MLFNDFRFLFVFLPIVLALFFVPGVGRLRGVMLLVASLGFYASSGVEHAVVLCLCIVWVFAVTFTRRFAGNRALLALAVAGPAAALFYYKYLAFVVRDVLGIAAGVDPAMFSLFGSIVLPAGISFFTFELVSYAVDRYRGQIPERPGFVRFALFVSFFPHLIAGPILRYRDVAGSLVALPVFRLATADASAGIAYITLGLASKVLIADSLHNALAPMVAKPDALGVVAGAYVLFAYSFQIYFDFYGYSLVAIGLARLFGFRFPANFDRPYESPNPQAFWRRWNITLSYWIRDYLYRPLGGNERYARNILIVFALCGLWHGAGWTFVIWGLYHAALVILYKATARWWDLPPLLVQRALTFVLATLGWMLFLFDFHGIQAFARSLVGLGSGAVAGPDIAEWLLLLGAAAACFGLRFEAMAERLDVTGLMTYARTAAFSALFVAMLLFIDRSQTFIYFRF